MRDVQNFFHKALAVILQKSNIYTSEESYRRAVSSDTFSSCAVNVCGSYAQFIFFAYKLPLNKNVNALRLYCTDS